MLTNESGSYYEEYRRSKRKEKNKLEDERLLTDRAAYLTFLEVQLERVSAACLTSQSFSERIEQNQSSLLTIEERLNNLAREVRTLETQSETKLSSWRESMESIKSKQKSLDGNFDSVNIKVEHMGDLVEAAGKNMEAFELRHQQNVDVIRRNIEQKVLEFGSRLDLAEARGRSNETKIGGLGDLCREEAKSSIGTMQSQMEVKLSAMNEQLDCRISSLESRMTATVQQLKFLPGPGQDGHRGGVVSAPKSSHQMALPLEFLESQLRDEIKETRNDLTAMSEQSLRRVMETLRKLEQRVEASDKRKAQEIANQSIQQELGKLAKKMGQMDSVLREVQKENDSLRSELARMKAQSQPRPVRPTTEDVTRLELESLTDRISLLELYLLKETEASRGPLSETSDEPVQMQAAFSKGTSTLASASIPTTTLTQSDVQEIVNQAVLSHEQKVEVKLHSMDEKLECHSNIVNQSMERIDRFMQVYAATQSDLKDRLSRGREHQSRLSQMIRSAAVDMEDEEIRKEHRRDPSPFRLAYDELSELVDVMQKSKAKRKKERLKNGDSASKIKKKNKKATTSAGGSSRKKHREKEDSKTRHETPKSKSIKRRSLSAEPGTKSHERPTLSSVARVSRRSKTPPPFFISESEGASDSNYRRGKRVQIREGGGKKGRDRDSMASSDAIRDILRDDFHSNGGGGSEFKPWDTATGPHHFTDYSSDGRPPWNAGPTHPLNRARSSSSSSSGYSSTEEFQSTRISSSRRRDELKKLYKDLSSK